MNKNCFIFLTWIPRILQTLLLLLLPQTAEPKQSLKRSCPGSNREQPRKAEMAQAGNRFQQA